MTDPVGENRRNPGKKHEDFLGRKKIKYSNNKHNVLVQYNRWKKHNKIQLTKKENGFEQSKKKSSTFPDEIIIHNKISLKLINLVEYSHMYK